VDGVDVGTPWRSRIKEIAVTLAGDVVRQLTNRWKGASTATRYCAAVCPGCGTEWPETRLDGIGPRRCAVPLRCGHSPFTFTNGYTMAFDEQRGMAVTVGQARAEAFARDAGRFAALPTRPGRTRS
jgi:hypothetical protein